MENTNEIAESDLPNDIKNLTAVEARNWLSYTKPWTLEQATLIFAGHSPKSRYFFKDDGASGFWLAFNFWHRFKSLQKDSIPRSQNEWLELAERESWPLPDPLIEAMSSESKNNNLQPKFESALERQSRRYQMCLGLGKELPKNDYARMPNGVKNLAKIEGVSRQAFVKDVRAHMNRLNPRK